jgi:hypothetical protein
MAFLVFTSSISFAIDIHYCGGQVQSVNFFGEANTCSMKEQYKETASKHKCCEKKNSQASQCKMKSEKKDCCHNEQFVFEQGNDLKLPDKSTVNLENINPVLVYVLVSQRLFELDTKPTFCSYYDPPLLPQDILVQQQVFRI